ncbi:MAG: phytanoyl-CoA dioxygenase family protein [Phycisphaeraceae bacterium]|nr:phytanoyl-CoA dioxygenase family protein [Phycisphaeraceae bacterium]
MAQFSSCLRIGPFMLPSHLVDDVDLASFERDGFLTVANLADQDTLNTLNSACRRLLKDGSGLEQGDQFDLAGAGDGKGAPKLPQIMWPSRYAPELSELAYRQSAQALAERLLGGPVQLTNEHMIYKPPQHGSPTPWHQDQAYHSPDMLYNNVNIWLALADATIENGCMQYVPGSHKLDVLPHHPIGNNATSRGLEVDNPEQYAEQAIPCPVPAGGVAVHRSYVLHYAGPNRTSTGRPAYILVFGREPQKRDKPLRFPWLSGHHDGAKARS